MKDLFDHREELSKEVNAALDKFEKSDGEIDAYQACRLLEDELYPLGYEFDWGLDGIPSDLRELENLFRR